MLRQSTSGTGPVEAANMLELLKLKLTVAHARGLAVFGANGALVTLVVALAFAWLRRPKSEAAAIAQRFGALAVDVLEGPELLGASIVAVGSFDGLLQVAEQMESTILRFHDVYFLRHGGLVYVYEPGEGSVEGDEVSLARFAATAQ